MTRGKSDRLPTYLPARYRRGFAWEMDRRSVAARELAAGCWELWQDLGGVDALSAQQRILVERAIYLRRRLLDHESAVLRGEAGTLSPGEHSQMANTLLGLMRALGIERRAKTARTLRDVMAGTVTPLRAPVEPPK